MISTTTAERNKEQYQKQAQKLKGKADKLALSMHQVTTDRVKSVNRAITKKVI